MRSSSPNHRPRCLDQGCYRRLATLEERAQSENASECEGPKREVVRRIGELDPLVV
jgi:hypothetical protein